MSVISCSRAAPNRLNSVECTLKRRIGLFYVAYFSAELAQHYFNFCVQICSNQSAAPLCSSQRAPTNYWSDKPFFDFAVLGSTLQKPTYRKTLKERSCSSLPTSPSGTCRCLTALLTLHCAFWKRLGNENRFVRCFKINETGFGPPVLSFSILTSPRTGHVLSLISANTGFCSL